MGLKIMNRPKHPGSPEPHPVNQPKKEHAPERKREPSLGLIQNLFKKPVQVQNVVAPEPALERGERFNRRPLFDHGRV